MLKLCMQIKTFIEYIQTYKERESCAIMQCTFCNDIYSHEVEVCYILNIAYCVYYRSQF